MVNLMKAQRIMRYTRAKRVHLSEVRVVKKYRTLSSKPLKKFRHDEKLLYLCGAKPEERCRSGRSGRSRKPLYPYGYPGFESLSFRKKAAFKAAFLHLERRDENPGGFVTAQRSAKQRLPVFPQKSSPQGCFFWFKPKVRCICSAQTHVKSIK